MAINDGRMKEDVSRISFCIESIAPGNGRHKFKKDDGGFYIGVPIAAIGVSTRNNSYYDVKSFVSHLEDPSTPFNMMLKSRQLYGEMGHPDIIGMEHNLAIARIRMVAEANSSHLFKSIYTGPALESGGRIVYADLKPINLNGVGARVKESLEDPEQNTAFSIRTLTANEQKGNISYRKMLQFVTADFVNTPGFAEATKGYAHVGTESFKGGTADDFITVDYTRGEDGFYVADGISTECFNDGELNELFGSKSVKLLRRTVSLVQTKNPGNRFFTPSIGKTGARLFLGG